MCFYLHKERNLSDFLAKKIDIKYIIIFIFMKGFAKTIAISQSSNNFQCIFKNTTKQLNTLTQRKFEIKLASISAFSRSFVTCFVFYALATHSRTTSVVKSVFTN